MEINAAAEWFFRALGWVYLIALTSLYYELMGLYGSQGIVPLSQVMKGCDSFWDYPSLLWISSSDRFLKGLALSGIILSLVVISGFSTTLPLFCLWLIFLSFVSVGSPFYDYQWDTLLLETGLIAWVFSLHPSFYAPMLMVLIGLLFRLLVSSYIVKWRAHTSHWCDLKAMEYHYESQPLPNPPSFLFHQQSKGFARLSCYGVVFFELFVPCLFFWGYPIRILAFGLTLFFQLLISFTGNFAYFNLLTMVLAIPLLTDFQGIHASYLGWALGALWGAGELFMLLRMFYYLPLPSFIRSFYLFSTYGLFADMTVQRKEIVIEGSLDGQNWKAYDFKFKPQDLNALPRQIAPWQPRLDWQMWFLQFYRHSQVYWFQNFLIRLLEGSPPVLNLLKGNPFPDAPPRFIRAVAFNYRFTTYQEWKKTGHYWERTKIGLYVPPLTLR